ncbi:MAG: hypothetical protein RMJ28_02545 [Nitrososphaerota archaeon]|nr:hypothetical protein [Candidatus Calditenuaceae archaeon]MDW8073102.1 hypothetical protein [Nitrososphaerota archaeon]
MAIVTEGARGIGYAVSLSFVREGSRVAKFDIDNEKAENAA